MVSFLGYKQARYSPNTCINKGMVGEHSNEFGESFCWSELAQAGLRSSSRDCYQHNKHLV